MSRRPGPTSPGIGCGWRGTAASHGWPAAPPRREWSSTMTQLVKHGAALAMPPALPPALSPGLPQESLQRQLERAVQSPPVDRLVRRSLLTLAITLLPIAGWATMTVAERAVLSQGQLVPEGRRKTVNLLEPGILRRLMVQEGSVVQAGQPLLQLDVTQAESQAGQAKAAYWSG